MKAAGARRVYVIDNCTQGNFTRLVFRVSGLEKAAKQEGALPVYLDEGPQVPVLLPNLGDLVRVSAWVRDKLIDGRDDALYLNMPKLKMHLMAQVTLGVKNQLGLVMQADRIRDHNEKLHRKLADIFNVVRPDFTLIEGLYAFNHGHHAPQGSAGPLRGEAGGPAGKRRYNSRRCGGSARHGRRSPHRRTPGAGGGDGLGEIDLEKIEIIGDLQPYLRHYTWEPLDVFPPYVQLLKEKRSAVRKGATSTPWRCCRCSTSISPAGESSASSWAGAGTRIP